MVYVMDYVVLWYHFRQLTYQRRYLSSMNVSANLGYIYNKTTCKIALFFKYSNQSELNSKTHIHDYVVVLKAQIKS